MSTLPQRQDGDQEQDWVTSICDHGEGGDCPRSFFLGCDQLSRTRFRLGQLDTLQDPLDLSHHRGCNVPCWNYFLLCVGTLYIGSGVYTGKVTGEIRKKYNIKGNHCDDVANGIFCQPCSLIRNELEVRRRETDIKSGALKEGLRGPLPLGEENFRPMFAMANTEGYQQQPLMSAENQRGVAHVHQSSGEGGSRIVPLHPTEQDLMVQNQSWRGFTDLPQIPHVSSPLGIDRRSKLLTPISELDSSAEDSRSQPQQDNVPGHPQVQNWLKSMSPSGTTKQPKGKKAKPCPGPEDCEKNPQKAKSPKPAKKTKFQRFGGKSKQKVEASGETPNIMLTAPEAFLPQPAPGVENVRSPIQSRRSPEHNLRADILVASPSESQRQHSLQADVMLASPSEADRRHNIEDDDLVASPLSSVRQHNLDSDARILTPIGSPSPQHALAADEAVQFQAASGFDHRISKDEQIPVVENSARYHSISKDKQVGDGRGRVQEHDLDNDEVLVEEPESEPEPESSPEADVISHTLVADPQVILAVPRPKVHSIGSDTILSTQRRLQAREHSLSRDIRVLTPTSQGSLAHGIHLDERVPTPELIRLNMEHDILRDRRVLTPSSINTEHNLQADERVKTPASIPPREHAIESDKRVLEPASRPKPHQIASDDLVVAGPSKRAKEHSLGADNRVAQRAFQLLENFLEQDKRPSGRGSKG